MFSRTQKYTLNSTLCIFFLKCTEKVKEYEGCMVEYIMIRLYEKDISSF